MSEPIFVRETIRMLERSLVRFSCGCAATVTIEHAKPARAKICEQTTECSFSALEHEAHALMFAGGRRR